MIRVDEPYLTIHWDEDTAVVWMQWKDAAVATSEQFRRAQNQGVALIQEKKAHKWLGDIRNLAPLPADDLQWSSDDWFPHALAAGIRWMALVVPRKIIVKMAMRLTMAKVDEASLVTAYFDNLEEARAWLKEQR